MWYIAGHSHIGNLPAFMVIENADAEPTRTADRARDSLVMVEVYWYWYVDADVDLDLLDFVMEMTIDPDLTINDQSSTSGTSCSKVSCGLARTPLFMITNKKKQRQRTELDRPFGLGAGYAAHEG